MFDLAQEYSERYDGNRFFASLAFATDLMASDKASFKRGYGWEAAVMATARAFTLTASEKAELVGALTPDAAKERRDLATLYAGVNF
jgi:hypothetical protein